MEIAAVNDCRHARHNFQFPNLEGICELETPVVIDAIKHRRQIPQHVSPPGELAVADNGGHRLIP